LPFYDTSFLEAQILRAYKNNDTSALEELIRILNVIYGNHSHKNLSDSCIKDSELKTEKVDELYQFEYWSFMCPFKTRSTITKRNDTISLRTIVYQYAEYDQQCQLIDNIELAITNGQWKEFQDKIKQADLWGMKTDNGDRSLDGSTVHVYGFKRRAKPEMPDRQTFIFRSSPINLPIITPFLWLLNMSKVKSGCIRGS
jgi:hypothetical protein